MRFGLKLHDRFRSNLVWYTDNTLCFCFSANHFKDDFTRGTKLTLFWKKEQPVRYSYVTPSSRCLFHSLQLISRVFTDGCKGTFMIMSSALWKMSRDSSTSIVTWLQSEQPEFSSRQEQGRYVFLFATASIPALGPTQSHIQWAPGIISPEFKRPMREADQSPPFSVGVKNVWSYLFTLTYVFMVWIRDIFTLWQIMIYLAIPHL